MRPFSASFVPLAELPPGLAPGVGAAPEPPRVDVLAVGRDDVLRVGVHRVGARAAGDAVDLAVAGLDRVVAVGVAAPQRAAVAAGEVAGDRVAAGAADQLVVAEAAVDAVVPGAAVEAVGAVAGAQAVVAAAADHRGRRADLAEAELVRALGAGERAADVEPDLLDAAEVVALARAPVVGAAAERDRHGRVGVAEAAGVVALDAVGARAAVDDVGVRVLVAVGGDQVVAGAGLDRVPAVGALDRVVAVAAAQEVVALVAHELVLAGAAVEHRPLLAGGEPVGAGAAVDRHGHGDAVHRVRVVVARAELHADRGRHRAGDDVAAVQVGRRTPGRRVHRITRVRVEGDRAVVVGDLDADVVLHRAGARVDQRAVGRAGHGRGRGARGHRHRQQEGHQQRPPHRSYVRGHRESVQLVVQDDHDHPGAAPPTTSGVSLVEVWSAAGHVPAGTRPQHRIGPHGAGAPQRPSGARAAAPDRQPRDDPRARAPEEQGAVRAQREVRQGRAARDQGRQRQGLGRQGHPRQARADHPDRQALRRAEAQVREQGAHRHRSRSRRSSGRTRPSSSRSATRASRATPPTRPARRRAGRSSTSTPSTARGPRSARRVRSRVR